MSLLTKVIPQALNYSDIKPESIDTEIKLVKFVPTSTVNNVKSGEILKFLISGMGFYDPYSAYLQFKVKVDDLNINEIRTVDRSAHSFIQSIIIRSQGTEIERITDYDVMASMINDMIYSSEQEQIHSWEGFPTQQVAQFAGMNSTASIGDRTAGRAAAIDQPLVVSRAHCVMSRHMGASPLLTRFIGEQQFADGEIRVNNQLSDPANAASNVDPQDFIHVQDGTQHDDSGQAYADLLPDEGDEPRYAPLYYSYHENGIRKTGQLPGPQGSPQQEFLGNNEMTFIIPLYSGVMGTLMPDKKLLPLGLMPLEVEITLNPHALYSNRTDGTRNYVIESFNLYSHVIFFESDIHKQLEAQAAEHGIFIYCNSFMQAQRYQLPDRTVPVMTQISVNLKSMNSVHMLFNYNHYQTNPVARKLHFVSHNIRKLQLQNGTTKVPQYAIEGNSGTSYTGQHVPFLVETMKAYNKLHDPKTDGAIHAFNFCGDVYGLQMDPIPHDFSDRLSSDREWWLTLNKQGNVGRCQYGISMEGEELGTDKMMVTGRKVEYPFYIELLGQKTSTHPSYMWVYIKHDFIIYIRPDLQIVTLGK